MSDIIGCCQGVEHWVNKFAVNISGYPGQSRSSVEETLLLDTYNIVPIPVLGHEGVYFHLH